MSSLVGLTVMVVRVGLGAYRKVKGDRIPTEDEKKAEKQTKKLDKEAMKRGTVQDHIAALNAHVHLETLREARHRRLLALYLDKGDMQKVQEEERELDEILKRKEGYLQQLNAAKNGTRVVQGQQTEWQTLPPAYQR